ncbi:hypothetical protein ACXUPC_01640 [Pseudomonas marginalis]|uniref:hypothetical protein n=1 Tax=Pseudomonas marginalis TaxID=298 RepID=UPI0038B62BF5
MPSDFLQSGVPDAYTTTRERLTLFLSAFMKVAALNALLSAGYLGNNPVTLFALFPLFQSLFCLLILNTRNHRRFVSMLRVKRRQEIRANAQT